MDRMQAPIRTHNLKGTGLRDDGLEFKDETLQPDVSTLLHLSLLWSL